MLALEIKIQMETQSLWSFLHDSSLICVKSDSFERNAILEFKNENITGKIEQENEINWNVKIENVSRLIALKWELWPGNAPELNGLKISEQEKLTREYQEKGRTTSVNWNDFEKIFNRESIWIKDGTIITKESGILFETYGHTEKADVMYEIKIYGSLIKCIQSDQKEIAIEELIKIGNEYWENAK